MSLEFVKTLEPRAGYTYFAVRKRGIRSGRVVYTDVASYVNKSAFALVRAPDEAVARLRHSLFQPELELAASSGNLSRDPHLTHAQIRRVADRLLNS